MNDLIIREYDRWADVIKLLLKTGAVTGHDCEMANSAEAVTDGQKLFKALRVWSDSVVDIRIEAYIRKIKEATKV